MEKGLEMPGVFIHLYGKEMTAPMRKMGHATIVAPTIEAAIKTARLVQKTLKIKCL
jgi:5-(carboxyamino)imidazole ribonucleotide synthase